MLDLTTIPLSYTVLNFVLAMAMYTLIARFILGIFFDAQSNVVIWKAFQQISDPILRLVRFFTPAIVPFGLIILFGVFWTIGLRLLLLLTYLSFGWISLGGA
jgi:uncharacterized protein YggT (Ycf19 family)